MRACSVGLSGEAVGSMAVDFGLRWRWWWNGTGEGRKEGKIHRRRKDTGKPGEELQIPDRGSLFLQNQSRMNAAGMNGQLCRAEYVGIYMYFPHHAEDTMLSDGVSFTRRDPVQRTAHTRHVAASCTHSII